MKEIGKKRTFVLHQTNGCFTSNERSFNFICPFVFYVNKRMCLLFLTLHTDLMQYSPIFVERNLNCCTMKNRIGIWLVSLLLRRKRITLKEIQKAWKEYSDEYGIELHRNTFMKYKRLAEEMFDINIECDRRTNEYYIDAPEEINRSPLNQWLIRTTASSDVISRRRKLDDRIVLEMTFGGEEHLDVLTEAMMKNKCVSIVYHSYWGEAATFTVEPYFIKFFKQRWYLIGFCREREGIRVYSFDRMDSAELSAESFRMSPEHMPQVMFNDTYGIINDDNRVENVILKFNLKQGNYIRTRPLHHSQELVSQDEDSMTFRLRLKPTLDFVQELLSYGSTLQVLAPESLVQEMRRTVNELCALYRQEGTGVES